VIPWRWGLIAVAAGLVPRLLLWTVSWSHPERAFYSDTYTYLKPALQLLQSGSYPADSTLRTPVYPLFIALTYGVFGASPSRLILVQMMLSAATVLGTLVLGCRLLPRRAAIAGALLMAFSLESITQPFAILSETLFTLLLLLSVIAWVRFTASGRTSSLLVSACWMGLAILCRPIALYFPVFLAGAWLLQQTHVMPTALKSIALYALVLVAIIAPWVWRNARSVGIATVSAMPTYNMLYFEAAAVEAREQQMSADAVRSRYDREVQDQLLGSGLENTEANRARVWTEMAVPILAAHPFELAWVHLKADGAGLLPDVATLTEILGWSTGRRGTLSILQRDGLVAAAKYYIGDRTWLVWVFIPFTLLLLFTYLTAIWGSWTLARSREWCALVVLLGPFLYFLVLPGPASVPRFRAPVAPYLTLLSGLGIHAVLERRQAMRERRHSAP